MTYAFGTADLMAATEEQMLGSYRHRCGIELLDFRHRRRSVLTDARVGGAVQVNTEGEGVTRSLSVDVLDPLDMLGLENAGGVEQALMVSVTKGIYVERYARWVDIPTFMGPLSRPTRSGDVLTLEAQDKAVFAMRPRASWTVKAGTNVQTAIKQIMGRVGETRFRIASTSRRLQSSHTLSAELTPLQLVRKICASVGWVAYYSGDGYLVCRPTSTDPVVTFRRGVHLMTPAQTGYWAEAEEIINQVTVVGGVVGRKVITATVTLPREHPLSPESQAFEGVPQVYPKTISNSDVGTEAEAIKIATDTVFAGAMQQTQTNFTARPWWHIEEYDAYAAETRSGLVTASAREMTIPCGVEDGQAFGLNARSRPPKKGMRVKSRRR